MFIDLGLESIELMELESSCEGERVRQRGREIGKKERVRATEREG
jgi:aryl carrier-like protein